MSITLYYLCYLDEETEAQAGGTTCPKAISSQVEEAGFEPRSLILRRMLFLLHEITFLRHSLPHALGSGQSREPAGKRADQKIWWEEQEKVRKGSAVRLHGPGVEFWLHLSF